MTYAEFNQTVWLESGINNLHGGINHEQSRYCNASIRSGKRRCN